MRPCSSLETYAVAVSVWQEDVQQSAERVPVVAEAAGKSFERFKQKLPPFFYIVSPMGRCMRKEAQDE